MQFSDYSYDGQSTQLIVNAHLVSAIYLLSFLLPRQRRKTGVGRDEGIVSLFVAFFR